MRRRKESDNYMTRPKTQSPFRPAKTQLSTAHHLPSRCLVPAQIHPPRNFPENALKIIIFILVVKK